MSGAIRSSGLIFATAGLIGVALFAGARPSGSVRAGVANHKLTFYAYATHVRFVNHADDRARGNIHNPFNADAKSLVTVTKGTGPFPGDTAQYNFKLYRDPNLKHGAGSAVYTCTFNFAHHAICTALYEVSTGTMFASGPTDFDSTQFTLAVTGGTGKYLSARGQVSSGTAAKNVIASISCSADPHWSLARGRRGPTDWEAASGTRSRAPDISHPGSRRRCRRALRALDCSSLPGRDRRAQGGCRSLPCRPQPSFRHA